MKLHRRKTTALASLDSLGPGEHIALPTCDYGPTDSQLRFIYININVFADKNNLSLLVSFPLSLPQ